MALKISLKSGEKIIIDGAVIKNGESRSDLFILNNVPVLREKDILSEKKADSPARRIYFTIQLMYIDGNNLKEYHGTYWKFVNEFINAAPSALTLMDQISENILQSRYYQALQLTKKLIEYEKEVINCAST